MNEIKVTVELCTEDRARLDKIIGLLEARAIQAQADLEHKLDKPSDELDAMLKKAINPEGTEAPKNAPEEAGESTPPITHEAEETPTEAKEAKPVVTMEMLRSKAITLAAAGKKDQVREVVHPYASKVTELPENTWTEVYEKLCELEG